MFGELVALFLFGLVIGSFINVLVVREATGESIGGRSHCSSCRKTLAIRDLVPVVSWLLLRGRCRYCSAPISPQYPLVELTTALVFVVVGGAQLSLAPLIGTLVIFSLYIAIGVFDLYYTLIPDVWSYAAALVALLLALVFPESALLFAFLAGPLAALPLFSLWAVSKGAWMGLGDAKLALSMGWLLGPYLGIVAIFFAFVIGAAVSLLILLPLSSLREYAQKKGWKRLSSAHTNLTMKSEIPFGPFLIVSCFILWCMNAYGIPISLQ